MRSLLLKIRLIIILFQKYKKKKKKFTIIERSFTSNKNES